MSTLKQKKLTALLPKNNWNVSRAALQAGYSPNSAKNPHLIMKGVGLQEIMENYGFSEKEVMREHKKVLVQDKNLPAKNTAIDMAYKLTGAYTPFKVDTRNLNIADSFTPEEISSRLEELKQELARIKGYKNEDQIC